MPAPRPALVVTVEHASRAVPPGHSGLGVSAARLRSHHGWDPGAERVGRMVARAFAAPLFLGRWSRLFVDLNRSEDHVGVVPRSAHGRAVPGNVALTPSARGARLARYWRPWRRSVEKALAARIAAHDFVLHLSVHSFTPRLAAQVRDADVGLLYDPRRRREREFVMALQRRLAALGYRVRRNYPYAGTDDGFTTHLRRLHQDRAYAGIEIEMNQRSVRRPAGARRFGADLVRALAVVFAGGER